MPNAFAYIALFLWPLVVVVLFRRMSPDRALIWSLLGGYLLLPEEGSVNLPLLPTFGKFSIPALSAGLMCWLVLRRRWRLPDNRGAARGRVDQRKFPARMGGYSPRHFPSSATTQTKVRGTNLLARGDPQTAAWQHSPRSRSRLIFTGLLLAYVLLSIPIMLTNQDSLRFGDRIIPSMKPYDMASMLMLSVVSMLPFMLARKFLGSAEAHRALLLALVVSGIGYSLLALVEVRFSPQLSMWLYGFYPHSFAQHIRDGGFRPMIFLSHGLRVGIFFSMTVLAALALVRVIPGQRGRWIAVAVWLLAVLVLSKTLGALLIALSLLPIALLLPQRLQLVAAALVAGTVLLYPMVRGAGFVPTGQVVEFARTIKPERAGSLQYRLDNEDQLLDRANERPLFGWGQWGRNRVYDKSTGRDLSVTDGTWIILIGSRGWTGYLALFGLLTIPILMLASRRRANTLPPATVGLAVVMVANLMDLVPNSSLTTITLLIGGALAGYVERQPAEDVLLRENRKVASPGYNRASADTSA